MSIISLIPGAGPVVDLLMKFVWKPFTGLIKLYAEYWRITVPITVALLGGYYHFNLVHKLERQIETVREEKQVVVHELEVCTGKKEEYGDALKGINIQLTNLQTDLDAAVINLQNTVNNANTEAKRRFDQIQADAKAREKTIPTDCRGALDWLKDQRYQWKPLNGAPQ